MRPISLTGHPIRFIAELRTRYGSNLKLHFSRYSYTRRSRYDLRDSFAIEITKISEAWLANELKCLKPGEELAFESRIRMGGALVHVPMLDFAGMSEGQLAAVMEILPNVDFKSIWVYFSGRSFHAYFTVLISPRQWVKFMGSALLANVPGHQVVDQRWIGHRLLAGYGALRWSWNTVAYKGMPRRIRNSLLNMPSARKRRLFGLA
jgi:hypothetical protein